MKNSSMYKGKSIGIKVAIAVFMVAIISFSTFLPAVSSGQVIIQSGPTYGYPFSVLNSTISEQGSTNSYQLQVGMDNAGTVSLAEFNLNLPGMFYAEGNASTEQVSRTNIQVGYLELSYPFYARTNATAGSYNFSIRVQYWSSLPYSGTGEYSANQTFYLDVPFSGTNSVKVDFLTSVLKAGQTNNLEISLENQGTGNVTDLKTTVAAQSPLTLMKSLPEVNYITPGSSYNLTAQLFVPGSVSGVVSVNITVAYASPYGVQSEVSNVTGLQIEPMIASVSISTSTILLNAGKTNNISFTFTNNGNINVSNVMTTPSSQAQLSFLEQFPVIYSLGVGQYFNWVEPTYVSASVTGAVVISLSETFITASGSTSSQQVSVGFRTEQASNLENVSLEVRFSSPYVKLGLNSSPVLQVLNIGNSTVYSPVVSIAAPSGFSITGSSIFYYPGLALPSGSSFNVSVMISSPPSISQGAYSSTVNIQYYNSTGALQTKTFTVGFLALAPVSLIVQSLSENASGNNITVSGTLLDEGSGSAYYLTLKALFTQQNISSYGEMYLGEIDSNTPTPFSITFSIPSGVVGGASSISIQVEYQNYYGEIVNSTLLEHSISLNLSGSSSTNTTDNTRHFVSHYGFPVFIGVFITVLIIILVAVGAVLLIKRNKRKGSKVKG
ncbi:MAG: hypothetical protein QXN66_02585 [Thermoplasmatales archaeon]